MAFKRTTDHDEIREWIEKKRGYPAISSFTESDIKTGRLIICFSESEVGAERIGWDEFFEMFEADRMRFRYDDAQEYASSPEWSYAIESRDMVVDADDETQLPEDADGIKETMFPSAPRQDEPRADDLQNSDATKVEKLD